MADKLMLLTLKFVVLIVVAVFLLWVMLARPSFTKTGDDLQKEKHGINPDVLRQHVEKLSVEFFPRSFNHPQNLDRVATYVAGLFQSFDMEVTEQVYEVNGHLYRNVIATLGPETKQTIIIGAHYDTAGELPGADDNASAVAGLIELGRLLSHVPLNTRVLLVAFTLEEPPFFATEQMGSAVFARSLKDNNAQVKLMIGLEMIGYYDDEKGSQRYPAPLMNLYYPSSGNFIAIVDQVLSMQAHRMRQYLRQTIDLPVYSLNAPAFIPGVDLSDHKNFWRHGYPAVMVTDTAFYRNTAYHSARDTADRLNYEKMAQVVFGIYRYVLHLSNGA